ncbi:aromatic amino acid aminotransferase [Cupriavidus basilensis OR16]|uniref:Aromatic amino acid aminotransferase n=1 Tax=Cupriavidus basilensis OR16 TaxID=1127483 RepID=H1S351_9BURK|nr:aromatic amino acid aminotransferase [Cupriavidus basilensis OR16]
MFAQVPAYPGDPILSLLEAFQADSRAKRANLSIGLYYDDDNSIPVLASVREGAALVAAQGAAHTYLPMEGMAQYRQALQKVIFGKDSAALREGRVATIQSVGGSGALRIGAEFLKTYFPGSGVWVSDPTWDNHQVLFAGAGLDVHTYPYYDAQTNGLKFGEMLETIDALAPRSIVLLQPCCHNPTGIDLSRAQWHELIVVLRSRELIPFIDMAYQGFGDGMDEDAWAIRELVDAGLSFAVSNSFSKNFSLYGERCGGLSIVTLDCYPERRRSGAGAGSAEGDRTTHVLQPPSARRQTRVGHSQHTAFGGPVGDGSRLHAGTHFADARIPQASA